MTDRLLPTQAFYRLKIQKRKRKRKKVRPL
jgi:hypothetical protein